MKTFKSSRVVLSIYTAVFLLSGCGGSTTSDVIPKFTVPATQSIQEGKININTLTTDVQNITFSIVGGADASKFTIDAQTGTLSFINAPDFETPTDANGDGIYDVQIKAQSTQSQSVIQLFHIKVINDPTDDGDQVAPEFTSSANFQIKENEIFEAVIKATDQESKVIYSIDGGADARRFRIDPDSGKLSFYHLIPDFEITSDANHDKIYEVTIAATDNSDNKAIQDITVTVEDDVTDSTYGVKKVFKTGLNDGGFGETRKASNNGNNTVTILEREWEDTPHVNENISYYNAHEYCAQLELGGENDWRLPTRRELYELVDYSNSPKIDTTFNQKNGGYFWTSQELFAYDGQPGDENKQAWTVQFGNAIDYASDKTENDGYHVRCVRGLSIPNGDFSGTLTITDNSTGIEWENKTASIDPVLDWNSAKTRCNNLNLDGKSDWRLPNINELHTIIPNNDNEYQFSDLTAQKTGPYWSSSMFDENSIYYVENYWDAPNLRDVQNDALIAPGDAGAVRSRCIRGGN